MSSDQQLSQQIEDILVARNPRGMSQIKMALAPGYCLRAAQILQTCIQQKPGATILIGTGFPVLGTFETDGPVGAIALYDSLELSRDQAIKLINNSIDASFADDSRKKELSNLLQTYIAD